MTTIPAIPNAVYDLAKHFEGLYLDAYRDPAGYWTQGYGHLLTLDRSALKAPRIDVQQAEAWLASDIAKAAKATVALSLGVLKPCQYGALVDFSFNLGAGQLAVSTLLKKVKRKAPDDEIILELGRWCYAGGKELQGLKLRRAGEAMLWLTGYFDPSQLGDYVKLFD